MALTDEQIRALDDFRREWGRMQPGADPAVNAGGGLERLRSLAEQLVAVQRCFHASGALEGPFTWKAIGSLVNALLRPDLPVPRIALRRPLRSRAAKRMPKIVREHDSPISLFRDLLIDRKYLSTEEWMYVLLRYHRIVTITKNEDKKLRRGRGGRNWKSNRPLNAYKRCKIVLDGESRAVLRTYDRWVHEQIKVIKRRVKNHSEWRTDSKASVRNTTWQESLRRK